MSGDEKRTEDTGTRIERRGENNLKKNDMAGEMRGKMQGRGGEEERRWRRRRQRSSWVETTGGMKR